MDAQEVERIVALAMDLARDGETAELEKFLDYWLPVDVQDDRGNSLLMLAAAFGHVGTVRMLLSRGADVDLRNIRNHSVLAEALYQGDEEIARILVRAGADVDAGAPTPRATAQRLGQDHILLD